MDPEWDKELFSFFLTEGAVKDEEASDALIKKIHAEKHQCVLEWELPQYNHLLQRQRFFAPSILYHCHTNFIPVNPGWEYVGFLEYDLAFETDTHIAQKLGKSKSGIEDFSFCRLVKKIRAAHLGHSFIILPSIRHPLSRLDSQKDIKMKVQHLLEFFLWDYNKRYGTNYEYHQFVQDYGEHLIPTQQSFISDIRTAEQISAYTYNFIEEHGYKHQDIDQIYQPFPATIMERFIGMFIFLHTKNYANKYTIPLVHKHSSGGIYR